MLLLPSPPRWRAALFSQRLNRDAKNDIIEEEFENSFKNKRTERRQRDLRENPKLRGNKMIMSLGTGKREMQISVCLEQWLLENIQLGYGFVAMSNGSN